MRKVLDVRITRAAPDFIVDLRNHFVGHHTRNFLDVIQAQFFSEGKRSASLEGIDRPSQISIGNFNKFIQNTFRLELNVFVFANHLKSLFLTSGIDWRKSKLNAPTGKWVDNF